MQSKNKTSDEINYTFETERFIIRLLEEQDREFFIALHRDEKVMKYNGGSISKNLSTMKFNTSLKYNEREDNKFRTWSIASKLNQKVLGILMLFRVLGSNKDNELEAGIIIERYGQGKLVPEEVIKGLFDFSFTTLNIDKVVGRYEKNNLAVQRYIKKLDCIVDCKEESDDLASVYFSRRQ